jgi:DNA-directed RNA polymerase subunit RPC12/RpoP
MCRYGMTTYKSHYACFTCRKTFKRRLLHDVARDETESAAATCPECGQLTASMGLDFKSPPKTDVKAWQHLRNLYSVGITYHSCGCSGPGYIPATSEAIVDYLAARLTDYVCELRYWLSRATPESKAEREKDNSKNWSRNQRLPTALRGKNGGIITANAIAYWQQLVYELEDRLGKAKIQAQQC